MNKVRKQAQISVYFISSTRTPRYAAVLSRRKRPDGVLRERSERRARQGVNDTVAERSEATKSERPDGDLNSGPWLRKPRG